MTFEAFCALWACLAFSRLFSATESWVPKVSDSFRLFPTVSDCFRLFPTVSVCFRLFRLIILSLWISSQIPKTQLKHACSDFAWLHFFRGIGGVVGSAQQLSGSCVGNVKLKNYLHIYLYTLLYIGSLLSFDQN